MTWHYQDLPAGYLLAKFLNSTEKSAADIVRCNIKKCMSSPFERLPVTLKDAKDIQFHSVLEAFFTGYMLAKFHNFTVISV